MLKRIFAIFTAALLVLGTCGCGGQKQGQAEPETAAAVQNPASLIPDQMISPDGHYEIAFCVGDGGLKDGGFSEGTYNGVKLFCSENNKSYKYYNVPKNATDEDFYDALSAAVNSGAKVVLCCGFSYAAALEKAAKENPQVNFIFNDGWALDGLNNVAAISFREQECGYFCGYAAVKEGYRKLGFCGGGGGTNSAVGKYGYGYLQGIDAAAKELGVHVDVNYSYQYGSGFTSSPELQAMCNAWYESGVECIFACGGQMFFSIASAAAANDGFVIGVDVDQSPLSRTVITSGLKRVDQAAKILLETWRDGNWEMVGGKLTVLGASENATGLPVDTWKMKNYTVPEYELLFEQMVRGNVVPDSDYTKMGSTENMTLKIM